MSNTRKRSLFIAVESTYGVDPSANGSGYVAVPAMPVGDPLDELEQLPTNYQTGRMHDTAPVPGADGGSLTFTVPLIGLSTAAGDAGSPPADDWLDLILTHIFGTQTAVDGEGVGSGSTTTNLVLDADAFDAGQLVVYNVGSGATQIRRITADATDGTYTVAPAMSPAALTAGVAYGYNQYRFNDSGGGATLSVVVVDDDVGAYLLTGGRITSCVISGDAKQLYQMAITMRFDARNEDASAKTALPAALTAPAITPLKALLSPLEFNGTYYPTAGFSLDLGIEAEQVMSTAAANGRADDIVLRLAPSITVRPLRTDALAELRRLVTTGPLSFQLGGGVLSGAVLNVMGGSFGNAYVEQAAQLDDAGIARQTVVIRAIDAGATGVHFQVVKA